MNKNMGFFTDDLWTIILAQLPLKMITTSKLVCKQWKSIIESPHFRVMFMSLHHSSSWSLMCRRYKIELVAHHRCKTWGFNRTIDSYISSFMTDKFEMNIYREAKVVAYNTDMGFILIDVESILRINRYT